MQKALSTASARALALAAKQPIAVLALLCLLAWLPGFLSLPPLDRDESRFAQATKQMVETGDYVDIRFQDTPRYNKPVGIYWLQAAGVKALEASTLLPQARGLIWPYRIPSLIGAFLAAALLYRLMRRFAGNEAAFLGAAMLALTLSLTAESMIAKTDAVLLAAVVMAQALLLRAYRSAREGRAEPSIRLCMLGWAAFGFGILIKGPVIVAVCGLSALGVSLWDREWRWLARLRPWPCAIMALMIVLPWFIAIGMASHGAFYQQSLGHDFFAKLVGGEESHGQPTGYYTLLASFTFWPATLVIVPAVALAWRRHKEPVVRYLFMWAASTWIMFELAPTKLPHYVLPAYPALAALAALWFAEDPKASARLPAIASAVLFLIAGAGLAWVAGFMPDYYGFGSPRWLRAAVGVLALAMAGTVWVAVAGRRAQAALLGCCTAVALYALMGAATVPRLTGLWMSPRIAELAHKYAKPGEAVVVSGYNEPSLIFLLGTNTKTAPGADAAKLLAQAGGLASVEKSEREVFLTTVMQSGADVASLGLIDGFNYSNGRPAEATLYRVTPGRPK